MFVDSLTVDSLSTSRILSFFTSLYVRNIYVRSLHYSLSSLVSLIYPLLPSDALWHHILHAIFNPLSHEFFKILTKNRTV